MVLVQAMTAVLLVSMVSLIGAFITFSEKEMHGKKMHLLLALAAGAMLGNAFLHLLPHAITLEQAAFAEHGQSAISSLFESGHDHSEVAGHHDHDHSEVAGHHDHDHSAGHGHFGLFTCMMLLAGVISFYAVDLLLRRSPKEVTGGVETEGWMVVGADMVENLLDGVVIGSAFLLGPAAGVAATITVFLHEFPLELGDYAVMRHAGFSKRKALTANFSSGLVSLVGVVFAVVVGSTLESFSLFATPLAAGGFLYIAGSVLVPKLRSQCCNGQAWHYLFASMLGVGLMVAVLFFE